MHRQADVVLLAGYFARCPLAGYGWQVLHYMLGLRQLGFDPYFVESTEYVSECFDPHSRQMTDTCAPGVTFLRAFFAQHGLADRWTVFDAAHGRRYGLGEEHLRQLCAEARLAISLAAVERLPPTPKAVRVLIDLDPGYTQIRLARGDTALARLVAEHHRHFTFGEHIGRSGCAVPTAGIEWLPTRQPIVTELWQEASPPSTSAPFTTVGRWHEMRRSLEWEGQRFGWSKRNEWRRFVELPRLTGARFVLAMDADKHPDDLAWLASHGWEVVDPLDISIDPQRYRQWIVHSLGEFTSAKDLNIQLRTGWFSDRSACYLAAGRPVVTQPTGFETILPVDEGLFAVADATEAAAAIASIRSDAAAHSAAARRIAQQYFEARTVLGDLLRFL